MPNHSPHFENCTYQRTAGPVLVLEIIYTYFREIQLCNFYDSPSSNNLVTIVTNKTRREQKNNNVNRWSGFGVDLFIMVYFISITDNLEIVEKSFSRICSCLKLFQHLYRHSF